MATEIDSFPGKTLQQLGTMPASQLVGDLRSTVIWAPDGSGDARTFYDVARMIVGSLHPLLVYVNRYATDPELSIPAGTWDLENTSATTLGYGDSTANTIYLEDGCVLRNPGEVFRSIRVVARSSSTVVEFVDLPDGKVPVIYAANGASFKNEGTVPCYTVAADVFSVLALANGTVELGDEALIHVEADGTLLVRSMNGSAIDPGAITCEVGGTIIFAHDGTTTFPIEWPGVEGTLLNQPAGVSGGAGPTEFRPVSVIGPLSVGCAYFDTTLGVPIWWDGTDWLDATGTPV
jgi:hypothetical protein